MGSERINQVIDALREAGFRAERGYPSRKMPDPASAVVAVCLAEQTREKAAVRAMVYCGGDLGGAACEGPFGCRCAQRYGRELQRGRL